MKCYTNKLLDLSKSLIKPGRSQKTRKACCLYYMRFNGSALLYREAKALKEKGFDVDVICLRDLPSEKIVQIFEGLKLYYIQARPSREKKKKMYFLRLALFCIKSMIFLSFLGPLKRYDLIHVTSPPDFLIFSAIIPKLLGAKIILDIHDIGPELYMRKLDKSEKSFIIKILRFIEKVSCQFADHVITVTDIWKEKLIKRSVQPTKCSTMLNVPDEDMFSPIIQKRKNLSKSFNLFYHGSLEEHFGVDTLLKAMPEVRQSIPNVELHIYGGGRMLEEFEALSTRLDIQDCVIFHGVVPFYELPKILMKADIGIVPTKASVFSDEALSMKSLEYISLGIPIVISKNKAHSYYYDDSVVKFFKPEDENDLAKSIILLCKNENERKQIVYNAHKLMDKYGWKKAKLKYFQIIDNLIA